MFRKSMDLFGFLESMTFEECKLSVYFVRFEDSLRMIKITLAICYVKSTLGIFFRPKASFIDFFIFNPVAKIPQLCTTKR